MYSNYKTTNKQLKTAYLNLGSFWFGNFIGWILLSELNAVEEKHPDLKDTKGHIFKALTPVFNSFFERSQFNSNVQKLRNKLKRLSYLQLHNCDVLYLLSQ